MSGYNTIAEFKLRSVMPPDYVDGLETAQPGWLDQQSETIARWIDARLRKRYGVPFEAGSVPEIVKSWHATLLQEQAYLRIGVDPTDKQTARIFEAVTTAKEEIKEAAEAVHGLFDLPLLPTKETAIDRGGPLGYSESSPYVWADQMYQAGIAQDSLGRGSE